MTLQLLGIGLWAALAVGSAWWWRREVAQATDRLLAVKPPPPAPPTPTPPREPDLSWQLAAIDARLASLTPYDPEPVNELAAALREPPPGPSLGQVLVAIDELKIAVDAVHARVRAVEDRLRIPLLDSPLTAEPTDDVTEPRRPRAPNSRPPAELPRSLFDFDPSVLLTPPGPGGLRAVRSDPEASEE